MRKDLTLTGKLSDRCSRGGLRQGPCPVLDGGCKPIKWLTVLIPEQNHQRLDGMTVADFSLDFWTFLC